MKMKLAIRFRLPRVIIKMIDRIPAPKDLAERSEWQTEEASEQHAGDIVEVDGVNCRLVPYKPDYTFLGWYSNGHPVTGKPGPGWSWRMALIEPERAMRLHGRTFTMDEILTLACICLIHLCLRPVPIDEVVQVNVTESDQQLKTNP
jgi:hypothetical protein